MTVWLMAATTVDGKLTGSEGGGPRFASELDRARLMASRARADAIVLGGQTVRRENVAMLLADGRAREARVAAGRPPHPAFVVVSASLDLPIEGRALNAAEQERVVATGRRAPVERRRALEARGVRVLEAGEDGVDPAELLAALRALGWREIAVEGGGTINASFLAAGVVDEVLLTIAPALIGGRDVPTLVDGAARRQEDRVRLALEEVEAQPTGELFVRYRVLR